MPSKYDRIRLDIPNDKRYRTTEEDRERMRQLYNEGWTQKEIAMEYGIAQSTVVYIVSPKARESRSEYAKMHPNKSRSREDNRRYKKELRERKRTIVEGSADHGADKGTVNQ